MGWGRVRREQEAEGPWPGKQVGDGQGDYQAGAQFGVLQPRGERWPPFRCR